MRQLLQPIAAFAYCSRQAPPAASHWNITSAGWQATLCDPIWHVSSSSGVATSVSELLYPCYFTLLYFTLLGRRRPARDWTRPWTPPIH